MISKEDIITGDNIETLGQYIFDIGNYINGDHGREKYIGPIDDLVNAQIEEINRKSPNIIFVYGHDTLLFLEHHTRIKENFTLITHNSDLGIYEEYIPKISNKIIRWFGQNNYTNYENIFALPIGIARGKYPHGNLDLLYNIISQNNKKEYLVFKNFSINTNFVERTYVNDITNNNGIIMRSYFHNMESYWTELSKSAFVICPPGNGVDCHRIWEALYLQCIPIVKKHIAFEQFTDLPILYIDRWEDVTIEFLKSKIDLINNFKCKNLEKINFSFWKEKIHL